MSVCDDEGAQSGFLQVTMGVQQGSILGPALFTINISEIVSSPHGCQIHLYMDDIILYCIANPLICRKRIVESTFLSVL